MGRKLARAVATRGPDGIARSFAAGDEAPDWLEAKITNPKVWDEDVPEDEPRSTPTAELEDEPERESDEERRKRETRSVPTSELEQDEDETSEQDAGPPPKGGEGSGRDNWAAYAEDNDIGVTDSMSRDDIIHALELAEVPTE